jgi:hypothetical protein
MGKDYSRSYKISVHVKTVRIQENNKFKKIVMFDQTDTNRYLSRRARRDVRNDTGSLQYENTN